jgi:hypothetical protein
MFQNMDWVVPVALPRSPASMKSGTTIHFRRAAAKTS